MFLFILLLVLAIILMGSGVFYILNPSIFNSVTDRFTSSSTQNHTNEVFCVGRLLGGFLVFTGVLLVLFLMN